MARAARYSSRIDVIVYAGCILTSLVLIMLSDERRDPIARSLRRTIVAPLVAMQAGAERWRLAWLESERRMLKTDTLALQAFRVHALQRENDQLRRIIGLGHALEWGFVPAEALRSATREPVVQTLTLTAGAAAGVQRYDAVVSADGVVGMVQTVDPRFSIAILFSHPDFRASAMTVDGTAYGIVYPRLGPDAGQYLLELRGVPLRYDVKPGTLVLTAGLGGTYPKGVPIGNVIKEIRTPEVWTRTYLVQPSVRPTMLTSVMILRSQRGEAGVEQGWRNVAAVDSAVRRIMGAGDSLARQDSLAAATARSAAALDSARRADPRAFAAESARADSVRRRLVPPAPAAGTTTAPRRTLPPAGGTTAPTPITRPNPPATVPVRPPGESARGNRVTPPPTPAAVSDGSRGEAEQTGATVAPSGRGVRDSARLGLARRDSARPDSTSPDSTRRDSVRPDTIRPDSLRFEGILLGARS